MNKKQKGFSLIELLIVVAIILIIAAIAIPNLLKARMAANESSAVGTLRTLNTAAVTYETSYNNGFPPTFAAFGPPAPGDCNAANLLDAVVVGGVKSGYNYAYTVASALPTAAPGCGTAGGSTYEAAAWPQNVGSTGQRTFCTDESGVIHFDPAGGGDPGTDTACELLSPIQ
jgi:type IV pilus assembly protein PilA